VEVVHEAKEVQEEEGDEERPSDKVGLAVK